MISVAKLNRRGAQINGYNFRTIAEVCHETPFHSPSLSDSTVYMFRLSDIFVRGLRVYRDSIFYLLSFFSPSTLGVR